MIYIWYLGESVLIQQHFNCVVKPSQRLWGSKNPCMIYIYLGYGCVQHINLMNNSRGFPCRSREVSPNCSPALNAGVASGPLTDPIVQVGFHFIKPRVAGLPGRCDGVLLGRSQFKKL